MADLRVLIVEDDPLDAELAVRELQKSGYDPEWQRVDTQAEFMNRLAQDPPDVIISDHVMPQFSSTEALQLFTRKRADDSLHRRVARHRGRRGCGTDAQRRG